MGFFRLILALAVFIDHAHEILGREISVTHQSANIFIWSGHAVFAFFILSGFYISMVITEKYSKLSNGAGKFYLNRALRLYPVNWLMLILFAWLILSTGEKSFLVFDTEPGKEWLMPVALFCNAFFFGAELIPFSTPENWNYVIGPVWSLSLELYFYVLAPFIVTRSLKTILALTMAGVVLRITLYALDFPVVPWRYFFFPSSIAFFMLGVLAYRLYIEAKNKSWVIMAGKISALALIVFIVTPQLWTSGDQDAPLSWLFYLTVFVCTPFLFELTKKSKIDRITGQLAYPVYLGHFVVMSVVLHYYEGELDKSVVSLIGTFLFAFIAYYAVDIPIERIRLIISKTNNAKELNTLNQVISRVAT